VDQSAGAWFAIERVIDEYIQNGFEAVLLIRLGAYVEFSFADVLEFHRAKAQPLTRLIGADGPLDFWMIDAVHFKKTGARFHKETCMAGASTVADYDRPTYVNRLLHVRDVRRLVVDAFAVQHSIRPSGREAAPGVWLDDDARVHPRARVEGPAYIGRGTRVEATALVTTSSSVERCCHISSGTVVADTSILANTYLGAWLDVSHAVVCGTKVAHLRHNVTVNIQDDRLIANISDVRRARPLFPRVRESLGSLRLATRIFKPQPSVIRAVRALFLAKRTQ